MVPESFFSIPSCNVHPIKYYTRRLKVVPTTYIRCHAWGYWAPHPVLRLGSRSNRFHHGFSQGHQAGWAKIAATCRHADMPGIFGDTVDSLESKMVLKWLWLVEMVSIAGTQNSGGLLSQHPSESSSDCELVVRYLPSSTILTQATHDAILPKQIQHMFKWRMMDQQLSIWSTWC